MSPRPARSRRVAWFAGAALAVLAVAVVSLALASSPGEPVSPSVPDVAALAAHGPSDPAPALDPSAPEVYLDLGVQGIQFPNWALGLGWVAVGARTDHLGGREVVTVYYQRGAATLSYAIVGGRPLAPPEGIRTRHGQTELSTFSLGGRLVVSWRRAGHTCVLSGAGVTESQLQRLAVPVSASRRRRGSS